MEKNLSLVTFAMAAAVVFAACGGDGNPDAGKPESPVVHTLTRACGVLDAKSGAVKIVLSDMEAGDIEAFAGVGHAASLILTDVVGAGVEEGVLALPAGSYDVASASGTGQTDDGENFFITVDKGGQPVRVLVRSGRVDVKSAAGKTTLEGELAGEGGETFSFTYTGIIAGRTAHEVDELRMTSAEVRYDNRHAAAGEYVYHMLFKDDAGDELSLELIAPLSDFFKNIPTGDYATSDANAGAGTIVSDNSYIVIGTQKRPISGAMVTIAASDAGYTVGGSLEAAGGETFCFSYDGPLTVSKATLVLEGLSELGVDGQNYGFTYNDYTFWITPRKKDAAAVKFVMYITGPLDVYYRYLPIPKGKYSVFHGDFPLPAWAIPVHEDVMSGTGFTFYDADGDEVFYGVSDGSIEIGTSEMNNTIFTIGFEGRLTAVNEDDPTDVLEIELTYEDSMPYWDGYYYSWTAHPFSTLKEDVSFHNFTSAVYRDYGYGYWTDEGGPAEVAYAQIALMPEGGVYKEWESYDPDPKNHYITIGLHLARTIGETGGLPAGIYKMDKNWKFTPGTFMPGAIMVITNKPFGLYLFNGPMDYQAPFGCGPGEEGGQVKIERTGDVYTITIEGYDDNWPDVHKISASYTGTIIPESQLTGSAAPAAGRAAADVHAGRTRKEVSRRTVVREMAGGRPTP